KGGRQVIGGDGTREAAYHTQRPDSQQHSVPVGGGLCGIKGCDIGLGHHPPCVLNEALQHAVEVLVLRLGRWWRIAWGGWRVAWWWSIRGRHFVTRIAHRVLRCAHTFPSDLEGSARPPLS